MSRVAKKPITIPKGVEVKVVDNVLTVKGAKGSLTHRIPESVKLEVDTDKVNIVFDKTVEESKPFAGTSRAVVNNMIIGVSAGFEKKLTLVGVGYRAQAKGNVLNLALGYSHPIDFDVPEGISVETPSQTEIVVRGFDKQKVGEVSAKIRAYRPPEPYKGKGVRYSNEVVNRKETKKKK